MQVGDEDPLPGLEGSVEPLTQVTQGWRLWPLASYTEIICYHNKIYVIFYHKVSSVIIFVTQEEIIYDHLTEVSLGPGKHNRVICVETPDTGLFGNIFPLSSDTYCVFAES